MSYNDEYSTSASQFVPGSGYIKNPGSPIATSSPRKGSLNNRSQPLVPTTIRQLLNAQQITPEAVDFVIDGQTVNQVSIVGLILSTNPQATNLNYVVDDGSGQIDVRIWIDQEDTHEYIQQKSVDLTEGRYVRVIGNLRAFGTNGKRSLVAFRLILIEDFNEITYHYLECIYAHIMSTRETPVQSNIGTHSVYVPQNQNRPPPSQNTRAPVNNPFVPQPQQQSNNAFTPLQNAILRAMENGHPQEGVSIDDVCEQLSYMADENDIRQEVGFLAQEGHLFTTIDDKHYALTGDD